MTESHAAIPFMESPPGAECVIDDRSYLYFGGTSYLGLHGHPEVIAAACEATRKYGIHPATSRSLFGNTPVTLAVERLAAEFFDLDDAFYFVSGYVSTAVLLQALAPISTSCSSTNRRTTAWSKPPSRSGCRWSAFGRGTRRICSEACSSISAPASGLWS